MNHLGELNVFTFYSNDIFYVFVFSLEHSLITSAKINLTLNVPFLKKWHIDLGIEIREVSTHKPIQWHLDVAQ